MKYLLSAIIFLTAATAHAALLKDDCQRRLAETEFDREPVGEEGLVTAEVRMSVESLIAAYRRAIFPWNDLSEVSGPGIAGWYSPPKRGVLVFEELSIGRSDMKAIRRLLDSGDYRVTHDQAFEQVMRECAAVPRWSVNAETGERELQGQWITELFIQNYVRLHEAGYAHSVEVWRGDRLVGGLYGVFVDGVYSGESMFHKENDVTKLAFYHLIERLKANGHSFMDTQQALPESSSLTVKWGAREEPRREYLSRLNEAQKLARPY